MKILAFCDTDRSPRMVDIIVRKAASADMVLCAGDLTLFGNRLAQQIQLLDSIGKPVLIIHGNHESRQEMKMLCELTNNVQFIHKKAVTVNDVTVLGYGGQGFATRDQEFEAHAKEFGQMLAGKKKTIFMTHMPPKDTILDEVMPGHHVGNKSFTEFIVNMKPTVVISGHIHETAGAVGKLGKTVLINPGWEGLMIEV